MDWILTKKKLPSHNQTVYVTVCEIQGDNTELRYLRRAYYERNAWWMEYAEDCFKNGLLENVVAWMEVPLVYEGEI